MLFSELYESDEVLSLDPATGFSDYFPIKKIIKQYYSGPMFEYEGKSVNFKVTPNHRMLIKGDSTKDNKKSKWQDWQFVEMQNIDIKHFYLKRDFKWMGERQEKIRIIPSDNGQGSAKSYEFSMDDWCSFLGWFVSEGDVYHHKTKKTWWISIAQSFKNRSNQIEIAELLKRMGLPSVIYSKDRFVIGSRAIAEHLLEHCGKYAQNKHVPEYLKTLPPDQIEKFLDSYCKGDGYKCANGRRYNTVSPKLADDVQELILKAGRYSTVSKRAMAGRLSYIEDHWARSNYDDYLNIESSKNHKTLDAGIKLEDVKKVNYDGFIYCVDVEPFHSIYVRRKGACFWSGNSTIKDFETYTGIKVPQSKEVVLENGSTIMFRHGDELNTLQNINLGVCGIEQAEEFEDDSQWFMLFGRMRRKNCGNPSLFLIANANGDNWINRLWPKVGDPIYKPAPGYELYEATTYDNADVLPQSFLDSLETLKVQKPQVYMQYVMNSREVITGKIFPMWNEDFHVIKDQDFPDWWETIGAMDTAVASGVFCAKLYKITPDGTVIAFKEYYDKEKLISEHCEAIQQMAEGHNISMWLADPSAFNKTREKMGRLYSIADELQDYGITVLPGENDVNAGINRMGEYLKVDMEKHHPYNPIIGAPRFMVTESCINTRREIPKYREVPNKLSLRGDGKWMPYKHEDHCIVGSTMIQTVDGPKPIESLVGMEGYVYCFRHDKGRMGVSRFHSVKPTRLKTEVIRVIFDNSDSITCTPDHLFLLRNRKYLPAGQLMTGMSLMPFYSAVSRNKWFRLKLCQSYVNENLENRDWVEAHRIVHEDIIGEIPDGYSVHHINQNGFDNRPENLKALSKSDHAIEELITYANKKTIKRCIECNKDYVFHGINGMNQKLFCSANCKSRHRRALGIDNVFRLCKKCGDEFCVNKYSAQKHCSRSCGHAGFFNHRVMKIESAGIADTFNLHVDIVNNFAANSVIVHNSVDTDRYLLMSRPSSISEPPKQQAPRNSAAWIMEQKKKQQSNRWTRYAVTA